MFVITGATGHIGSRAAEILLDKGARVVAVSRTAAHLQPLVKRGAEPAVGDLRDVDFLTRTFRGADGVFAMIPPDYTASNFRAFQNEVGGSIAEAIHAAGVDQVVNLSSQGAELETGTGPILGLRDQEERLDELVGVGVVHLRPGYFMENLLMNIPVINQLGFAGSALRGDLKIAMIATRDIGARVAELLEQDDIYGKRVEDMLGQRDISLDEVTIILGRSIDKPQLQYVQLPYHAAEKGMISMGIGSDAARRFIEMSRAFNEGRIAAGRPRTPQNTTPTSIEQFAEVFAAAYAASHGQAA